MTTCDHCGNENFEAEGVQIMDKETFPLEIYKDIKKDLESKNTQIFDLIKENSELTSKIIVLEYKLKINDKIDDLIQKLIREYI